MSTSCNHRIYLSCSCQFQSCSPVTGDYSSRHILHSSTTMAAVKPHPTITILKRTREDQHLSQNKFLKKTARGKVINSESLTLLTNADKGQSSENDMSVMISLVDTKTAINVHSFQDTSLFSPGPDIYNIRSLQEMATTSSLIPTLCSTRYVPFLPA